LVIDPLKLKEIFGDKFCLTNEVVKNITQIINENFLEHTKKRGRGSHNFCVLVSKIFPNPKSNLCPEEKEKYIKKFEELMSRIQKAKSDPEKLRS